MLKTLRLVAAFATVALASSTFAADGKKKVVFVAGRPSHGFLEHEHNAGCALLASKLGEALGDKVETVVYKNGWPKDANAFDGADAIIMYADGGGGHMVVPHLKEVDALAKKGVGIGCIHYAVEVEKDKGGAEFLDWIGGYFETFWSVNPVWTGNFTQFPKHPVTNGVKPFVSHDEWYYHMRFRDDMKGVTPILTAVPPDSTRRGKDDAHGGNPAVRGEIGKNTPEHTVWVAEREGGGRGFGCTGGHYHVNWANDNFRKTILNCIAWTAHIDIPADGLSTKRPTADDILANRDEKKMPGNFDKAKLQKQIDDMNQAKPTAAARGTELLRETQANGQ